MQVESQSDELWVQPNQRTIEFSDAKRQTLLKPYTFMDQVKLVSTISPLIVYSCRTRSAMSFKETS